MDSNQFTSNQEVIDFVAEMLMDEQNKEIIDQIRQIAFHNAGVPEEYHITDVPIINAAQKFVDNDTYTIEMVKDFVGAFVTVF